MIIGVIGLGLIGGSLCKAIKSYTNHACLGVDADESVTATAISDGSCDGRLDDLSECDVAFVCLHPTKTIEYILDNKDKFKKRGIVADVCGIKGAIIDAVEKPLADSNVSFVGCHPMAGREFSGYSYSLADMFLNAGFIIAQTENTDKAAITVVSKLANSIGFGKTVVTTPQIHDRTIAFTSQLAHVVSNAYIKSPTLHNESGFSAGSFLDLTRVAYLNADMWTDIFMYNKDALCFEIDNIIKNLTNYSQMLKDSDRTGLHALLSEGSRLKFRQNSVQKG